MTPLIDPMLVWFDGVRYPKEERTAVRIVVDGVPRPLPFHLAVRNHLPMGFGWGYVGSGSRQLALAMCVELVGPARALQVYAGVWDRLIAPMINREKWLIQGGIVMETIEEIEEQAN